MKKFISSVDLYEQNQSTPEFHRIFYFFCDGNGNTLDVVLLQYYFEGGKEVPVVVAPHGHSKSSRPFFRTQKSTLDKIRDTSQELKPREVVSKVFQEAGDSLGCASASEEPRNCTQIYNARKSTDSKDKDPIFDLIEQLRHHKLYWVLKHLCVKLDFPISHSVLLHWISSLKTLRDFVLTQTISVYLGWMEHSTLESSMLL